MAACFGIRRSSGCQFRASPFKNPNVRIAPAPPLQGQNCSLSTLVSGDARKGQEKGNVLDVAALRNLEACKTLNSQQLIDTCTRVCATDPLVLTRWWICHARCAQRGA